MPLLLKDIKPAKQYNCCAYAVTFKDGRELRFYPRNDHEYAYVIVKEPGAEGDGRVRHTGPLELQCLIYANT